MEKLQVGFVIDGQTLTDRPMEALHYEPYAESKCIHELAKVLKDKCRKRVRYWYRTVGGDMEVYEYRVDSPRLKLDYKEVIFDIMVQEIPNA